MNSVAMLYGEQGRHREKVRLEQRFEGGEGATLVRDREECSRQREQTVQRSKAGGCQVCLRAKIKEASVDWRGRSNCGQTMKDLESIWQGVE